MTTQVAQYVLDDPWVGARNESGPLSDFRETHELRRGRDFHFAWKRNESRDTAWAMSEENVEIVRAALAAFNEPERLSDYLSPDAIWDMSEFSGWPEAKEYRGAEEFFGFLAAWTQPYEEWSFEVERILDAGDNRVLALLHQSGRLRGSDARGEMGYGIVYTLGAGLIQRCQVFASRTEALEAAGLSE